jgi:carbon-monoxide dehydrogenase large subunit
MPPGQPDVATRRGGRRTEDRALLTGAARYVADVAHHEHPGHLHAVFVRSDVAGGRILHIDRDAAAASPDVVAVLTGEDLDLGQLRGHHMLPPAFDRPPLARATVGFAGDPVAVVVARTRQAAVDAAELVTLDVAPTAAHVGFTGVDDPARAVFGRTIGDEAATLAGAERVVRATFVNQRVASAPMEPDGALARPDGDGVVVWASTQRVHQVRDAIASSLGLAPASVRVIAPAVGGGFGGKFEPSPEAIVVAAVACRLGAAVLWTQTRTENLLAMPHGRAQVQRVALGLGAEATLTGIWVDIDADAGSYPMVGALCPNATLSMIAGPYTWPAAGGSCRAVTTSTAPVGAFRGAGRPEATAAIERIVDIAAHELGVDPLDLRRRHLLAADAFPFTCATGMTYDSGDYLRCLDDAARLIDYDAVRADQAGRRARGDALQVGVGVGVWLDCTPMNRPGEFASVVVERADGTPDGFTITVRDGANDQGQSHQTTWALLLGDVLRTPLATVRLCGGDTAHVATGEGTGSARSLQLAGNAVAAAAHQVLATARERAADLFEAARDDIVLDDAGRFTVRGTPARTVGWSDVVADAPLEAAVDFTQAGPTYPSGVHAAVVEVDTETGGVRLLRFVAVDDCGTVVNPVAVEGQQHGGIAQGIAQALYEEIVYDADGVPRTTSFADYLVPSAADLCAIDAHTIGIRSPVNPIGAKGIGQAGAIGSTPAVQNAVVDALAHLGVRHVDLPVTPQRVWRAILDA